jgi:hypothetical protein
MREEKLSPFGARLQKLAASGFRPFSILQKCDFVFAGFQLIDK